MRIIGVIGASRCDEETLHHAREVGRLLAERGCGLVTGGLGGVMEAASEGASKAGGLVIGILPGTATADANPHVEIAIATGMGDARNVIIANTGEAFVAVGGSHGTLSEMAIARLRRKPVASLGSWTPDDGVLRAATPEEAVALVLERLEG